MIPDRAPGRRAWLRIGLLLFAVGWGANHFAALLLVYRDQLALDPAAPAALLGMYALGLMPGLLLAGPLSDRRGRRAVVMPAACVALVASVALGALGGSFIALLFGRLVYGLGAGGAMSAGAVWVIELSGDAAPGAGARRATIAMSAGFGLGPLITGVLAQYAPAPTRLPYAVHVAVLIAILAIAWRAPAPAPTGPVRPSAPLLRIQLPRAGWRQFARGIAPMAPFVFAYPTIAYATLTSMLGGGNSPAYTGVLCVVTLSAGVLAQPITGRFEPPIATRLGLWVGTAGFGLGAIAVASHTPALLLVVAAVLGAAYGLCMTAGLHAVQRIALPEARGGITGLYYVLCYLGFGAPYLLALVTRSVAPVTALGVAAALVALVSVVIRPVR